MSVLHNYQVKRFSVIVYIVGSSGFAPGSEDSCSADSMRVESVPFWSGILLLFGINEQSDWYLGRVVGYVKH